MKKDVALVLSSGGARGIAHIGVIRELERRNYSIKAISGSSMGALVGGFYAAGELDRYTEWLVTLDRMDVLRLVDFSISSKGLIKGTRIIEKMKEIIPDRNIEELDIPFKAVATNIHTGQEKIFDTGNLYEAIRASIAIPTVFQPKKINESHFVDGGVLNPLPVNVVDRADGDLLFASDVNGLSNSLFEAEIKKTSEESPNNKYLKMLESIQNKIGNLVPSKETDDLGIFNLTNKSIGLMLHKICQLTRELNDIDLTFEIPRHLYATHEFHKAKEIIERGEQVAKLVLDEYENKANHDML
jgi:NTE family protein